MIEMLDATTEDAIERGSWIGSLTVLPSTFGPQDASKLLSLCPSVQVAQKSDKALILGDSYIFSTGFIKDLFECIDKQMETSNISGFSDDSHTVKISKSQHDSSNETGTESGNSKQGVEKGNKKKKGKSSGSSKANTVAEVVSDDQDSAPIKSKKGQRKGKGSSSAGVPESKSGAKKDVDKTKEEGLNTISQELIVQKITALVPDFEEQGFDDPDAVLIPLANHIRPMLVNSWRERKKVTLTGNSPRIKKLLDSLQKNLDESFLNMQLYEKALDLFDDDLSTSAILHRHLLRSSGNSMVDTLLRNLDIHNKLKNGVDVEEIQNPESTSISSGDRIAIAKSLPGSLSVKAIAVIEALEGKRVETFMTAFREIVEESGLTLKKLDKKLDRTLLHSYRKDLTSQVSAENDPISILPKVVSLLYIQIYGRALQAPGRAISVAVSRLKDKLDESSHKILLDYHSATVTLLSLMSAATGDEDDCSSDRITSKRELLESLMPTLKGLVLRASQS
jgi:hypothetical protein